MSRLDELYIFDGFSKDEVNFFLLMSQTQYRKAGETILRSGADSNGCAYYVTSGAVNVVQGDEVINTLGPGSFFGEIALITDEPRNATVIAVDDTELQVFLKDDFLTLFKKGKHSDEMKAEVLRRIQDRVQHLDG